MSEHHHKAQEHFIPGANANNSPSRAQKGDSVPEYVAGTQIVECQRPSSSKSKYRQDQNQVRYKRVENFSRIFFLYILSFKVLLDAETAV